VWKSFSCKITKVPVEFYSATGEFNLVCEWMQHGVSLILSLLTIDDRSISSDLFPAEGEGTRHQVLSVRYERNPINRELCLSYYGYQCRICGLDFRSKYGPIGQDFIHVHHIIPVSKIGKDYKINPIKDLIPVCPNCHAMLHRQNPPFEPDQLKKLIDEMKKA
jgi:5-methylcytosine-specific restriction protein A